MLHLQLGVYQSASLTCPGERVWPHQCSLQLAELGVLHSRPECHHANSTSTCLSLSYFYIFLNTCIYTVYRKQNLYFVTQGSKDHIKMKKPQYSQWSYNSWYLKIPESHFFLHWWILTELPIQAKFYMTYISLIPTKIAGQLRTWTLIFTPFAS